jgi:hypothetical protein
MCATAFMTIYRGPERRRSACYGRAVHGNPRCWAIAAALVISACAPPVDGPVDHQRTLDREDSDRLGAQLAQLPGVVTVGVVLHHAMRDPLAMTPAAPATAAAVIGVDDRADREAIRGAAARLVHAALPELPAAAALPIELAVVAHRPTLAKVGPFSVEDSSRTPLKATLALALLTIAALAVLLARRYRRGSSAQ